MALNEEAVVAEAITSVANWADRVVVLDSGSTDGTVEVAKGLQATVWTKDPGTPFLISDQRNWALDELESDYDWVLFLDADERATPAFLAEVTEAIADTACDGYYAAPKFMYQGTWLKRFKRFPNWHPRLVNSQRCRLVGGVWEDFPTNVRIGRITEPYLHIANAKGLPDWVERHVRYAQWEARERENGKGEREGAARDLARLAGPLRPWLSLVYHLLLRRGVLDGGSVWSYARRQLIYELLIVEARRETRRDRESLPR